MIVYQVADTSAAFDLISMLKFKLGVFCRHVMSVSGYSSAHIFISGLKAFRFRCFQCLRKTVKMVDEGGDRDDSAKVAIIREVYDGENAHETFEYELERALESECNLIVIEPSKLGDETSRWIAVGNCLHKTAALSGLGAIVTGLIWGDRPYLCGPLGFGSVISCGLYTVSWQFDPCCQYQVETDTSKLPHVELLAVLGPSSPTFLVRRDDRRRRILHTTITLMALGISGWRLYQAFK